MHPFVTLNANACLELRSRYAECGHCERICPRGALAIRERRMAIGDACIGCGRCMAACPTGALAAGGFDLRFDRRRSGAVTIDCLKAPAGADIRVPCLGGLSVSQLLELRLAAGERALELLDRGWCAECPAGANCSEHPAAKSLGRAQARLRDAGVPEAMLPRLRALPAGAPAPYGAISPGRRAFFARLAPTLEVEPQRFRPAPAPDRERVLRALADLSARCGGRVSAKLFHAVDVNPELCEGHGVCAAGCPTGALRLDDASQLSHATRLCIGCGHCERICPEKALRLVHGAGEAAGGRSVVAKLEQSECDACGARVARRPGGNRALCARCARSSALARAAFEQFKEGVR
jgi:ferredoxin